VVGVSNKILITGGAGYIGSVLVGQILNMGISVRIIDNLMFGDRGVKPYYENRLFELLNGDICNSSDVNNALKDIDTVIHLAAIVGDPACRKYPEMAKKVNKIGSELLYQSAFNHGVKRFVFVSTCSNYGKMAVPDGFVDETCDLNPISLYAELKVDFEQFLLANKHDDISPVILRFSTAYGLSPRPRFDLTVNEFTKELLLGRKLDIYGEQFWRPYCHTTDLAKSIISAVEADKSKVAYQAFNVGNIKENYRKKDIVDLILNKLPQMKNNIRYVKKEEDPRDYRVNFDKIKSVLDYDTSITVSEGIDEIINAINNKVIENPDDPSLKNI